MTNEEAMNLLDNLKGMIDDSQGNDYDSAFNLAIKGLEKQIPKEPFRGYIPRDLATNCGSCNSFIGFSDQTNRYNYCPNCGQAIKWE